MAPAAGASKPMRLALCLVAALAASACLAVTPAGPAAPRLVAQNLTREQIRSMPMVERPNRPIHFYGNAVRRRHHRALSPAPARPATPR